MQITTNLDGFLNAELTFSHSQTDILMQRLSKLYYSFTIQVKKKIEDIKKTANCLKGLLLLVICDVPFGIFGKKVGPKT